MSDIVNMKNKFDFNSRINVSQKFNKINSTISKLKGLISETWIIYIFIFVKFYYISMGKEDYILDLSKKS